MDPQHWFLGDDEDRDKLERMTEREREEELFKRAERREELKKRSDCLTSIWVLNSVVDPHHFDADPDSNFE
jgi:hypothetical protein